MTEIEMRNRICDGECAAVNGCTGHAACAKCGAVVCGSDIDEYGHCPDCSEGCDEREDHQ